MDIIKKTYIPALKYHFLTPIYDWFLALTMPEKEIREAGITLLGMEPEDKVLDFGCGTGTSLGMLKKKQPICELFGYDLDKKILKIASSKLEAKAILVHGSYEDKMPFSDQSFDKIMSTWVFHHLYLKEKNRALLDLKRVLKVNGKMIIGDWGKPANLLMWLLFTIVQMIDNYETMSDNKKNLLPTLCKEAGFGVCDEVFSRNTLFGTFKYWVVY